MELINGVSFEEYVALSAHLAQGVSEDEVMSILEIDKPTLDNTMALWGDKLAVLMGEDMEYATKFGEIFANPKVGRFASGSSSASSGEDLLQLVPTFEHYLDIFFHHAAATQLGIDPLDVFDIYHLNVGQWATIAMHYDKDSIAKLDKDMPDYVEQFNKKKDLMEFYQEKWECYYANILDEE